MSNYNDNVGFRSEPGLFFTKVTDASKKHIQELALKACSELREHVDTVQIFITKYDDEEGGSMTFDYQVGRGNYFARVGHVREWLTYQNQHQRNHAIQIDAEDDEEED